MDLGSLLSKLHIGNQQTDGSPQVRGIPFEEVNTFRGRVKVVPQSNNLAGFDLVGFPHAVVTLAYPSAVPANVVPELPLSDEIKGDGYADYLSGAVNGLVQKLSGGVALPRYVLVSPLYETAFEGYPQIAFYQGFQFLGASNGNISGLFSTDLKNLNQMRTVSGLTEIIGISVETSKSDVSQHAYALGAKAVRTGAIDCVIGKERLTAAVYLK